MILYKRRLSTAGQGLGALVLVAGTFVLLLASWLLGIMPIIGGVLMMNLIKTTRSLYWCPGCGNEPTVQSVMGFRSTINGFAYEQRAKEIGTATCPGCDRYSRKTAMLMAYGDDYWHRKCAQKRTE